MSRGGSRDSRQTMRRARRMRNAALFKGNEERSSRWSSDGGRARFWRENSVVLNLAVVVVAVASECKPPRFSDFRSDLSLTNISCLGSGKAMPTKLLMRNTIAVSVGSARVQGISDNVTIPWDRDQRVIRSDAITYKSQKQIDKFTV